ncbi:sequestosome-1-like isoform X1 [Nerophis lumbriciformis]|uniref:sequestosome-1-like isoform X1 n=1 Tax=Nerophis lumbriciformis TaxID=546530 RepID=UPI002AE01CAC|nr:sequestosome-1-like isoform X1 [Nerophis lumbriciformis]
MAKTVVVKAYLLGEDEAVTEIHKFPFVYTKEDFFKSADLSRNISSLFFNLKKTAALNMFYRDEEGDLVGISSDDELMMGLACMKDDIFRVYIKVPKEPQ